MTEPATHGAPDGRSRSGRATAADAAAVADVYLASFHATYDFPLAHTDDEVRGWIRDVLSPEGDVGRRGRRPRSSR